jgi:hypothetical protein
MAEHCVLTTVRRLIRISIKPICFWLKTHVSYFQAKSIRLVQPQVRIKVLQPGGTGQVDSHMTIIVTQMSSLDFSLPLSRAQRTRNLVDALSHLTCLYTSWLSLLVPPACLWHWNGKRRRKSYITQYRNKMQMSSLQGSLPLIQQSTQTTKQTVLDGTSCTVNLSLFPSRL